MKITYHGHSCFTVEENGFRVVLDPFTGVRGFEETELEAEAALCSHGHDDHSYTDRVKISGKGGNPFSVTQFEVPHDDAGGRLRGMNLVTVLEAGGKKIVHMGDTGCVPSKNVLEAIKGADALMIPVGGYYTIDAKTAAEIAGLTAPRHIIPMHYRDGELGYEVLGTVEDFIAFLSEEQKKSLLLVKGYESSVEI